MAGLTSEQFGDQLKAVEAGAVLDCLLYGFLVNGLAVGQQGQAIQLLARRQQVAFQPFSQHSQCTAGQAQPLIACPLLQPVGEFVRLNRPHRHMYAGFLKVLVPFTLGFRGIQPGADQQQDDVLRRGLQDLLEYLAAIAEFAGGQVNLDPAFLRKQRHGVAFVCYGVPVELMICVVGEAVLVTGIPGGLSNLVATLLNQQGFITGDQVNRCQAFFQ